MTDNKMNSLVMITFLCLGVILLYNFSVSSIHQTHYQKQLDSYIEHMRKSQLIVPTYNQNSYVSQNSLNNVNMNSKNSTEEQKKQTRMEFYNLCYDDKLNDDLNISMTPLNLFTHP